METFTNDLLLTRYWADFSLDYYIVWHSFQGKLTDSASLDELSALSCVYSMVANICRQRLRQTLANRPIDWPDLLRQLLQLNFCYISCMPSCHFLLWQMPFRGHETRSTLTDITKVNKGNGVTPPAAATLACLYGQRCEQLRASIPGRSLMDHHTFT